MNPIANEKITIQVSCETKDFLEKAVTLSGYADLNSFIANAAVAAAKQLIEQDAHIQLFREDAVAFVNALERPTKVNDHFLRAARKHKETITTANYRK